MTKGELIEKLNKKGIHQLRKGETMQDALDYVDGKIRERKGYKIKADNGRELSKNETIAESNKEAFAKSFTPAEYKQEEVEDIDDICDEDDQREDKSKRGVIVSCQYCGTALRVDGDGEDYDVCDEIVNCEDCMSEAIFCNCM